MHIKKTPSRLSATVRQPIGQVQISLDGKPLFVASDAISFLGEEAARTIGDGARWRHPFPQSWEWPPKEPTAVQSSDQGHFAVQESSFIDEYQSKPRVEVTEPETSTVEITTRLENLSGQDKQAWLVAPFAMPEGHTAQNAKALAVLPASRSELDNIPDVVGDTSCEPSRWQEDHEHNLLFVHPGATKSAEQPDKLHLTDRWSLFAREGDESVLLMPPTGSDHSEAFQVYAGFDNYVELEWAGPAAAMGQHSRVTTRFQAVPLASLALPEGMDVQRFGDSGTGLQAELTAVVQALGLDS